jgi:excinuclease UvrABC nuclease subunit
MPITGDKHPFTRRNVELVPDAPGVYALFDDTDVAYYGSAQGGSDTIRARLGDHLAGRQAPGRVRAKLFSFEVTHYPLSRERALLEEHKRAKWRLPEFNASPPERRGTPAPHPDARA